MQSADKKYSKLILGAFFSFLTPDFGNNRYFCN